MSLLTTVQEFCGRTSIPVPTTVFGTTDVQVLQVMRLLEEGCIDMSSRGAWEELINEASWSTTASEDQGALTTLAPNGYRYLIPETLWDRTEKLPLLGPMDSQDWQALKAIVVTGPRYSFRIRQGHFRVTPAPPAAHTWVFEYVSKNWLEISSGSGTFASRFTNDNNVVLLPDDIVTADLRWRWKKEKGLAYAEDFNTAERMVTNALGRSGGKKVLCMDMISSGEIMPGIFVPSGTWNL